MRKWLKCSLSRLIRFFPWSTQSNTEFRTISFWFPVSGDGGGGGSQINDNVTSLPCVLVSLSLLTNIQKLRSLCENHQKEKRFNKTNPSTICLSIVQFTCGMCGDGDETQNIQNSTKFTHDLSWNSHTREHKQIQNHSKVSHQCV